MNGKRPFVMTNSMELSIFNKRRPLKSAAGAVAVVRGEEGGCAGLVSPTRWKRAWESSGVMCPSISSAV